MRVLMAIAVVLLATSAAEAQYSFEYNGRIIRINPDRGTVSIPGVFDNTPKKSKRAHTDQSRARQPTNIDSTAPEQTAPAASLPATAPAAAPATAAPAASAATTDTAEPASTAPRETAAIPAAPTAASETPSPAQPQPAGTATTPAIAPPTTALTPPAAAAVAPATPAVPKPAETIATANPPPAAAPRDPHSPIGVWLTEEKAGKVRIEPCGANLCGYSVDTKSNENAEQVLINMKQGKDQKWSGRILDPNTGSTYDSTIGLIGANALRVQGCAFNGMFCGGQTWTRIN